ncbi:helix-turn-helix domain-containing protein [Nonomuraea sp. NPDC048916]|uniref:TetR/AcrR family transcriptional regulator n=1 Tax=Nonomuraea sp. NPDC048916 TaxID=3154232 RepID=UPI0033DE403F
MVVRPPGFGRTRNDERERARDQLVDTALRLFAERGYVGVRVEDIAKAAGISRATFYKHFSEREEILAELFARLLGGEPVSPRPGAATEALPRIRELLTGAAARMVASEQLARFVYTLPIRHAALLGQGTRPPVLEAVERVVEDAAAVGALRTDVPPMLITAHLARTFEAAMRDWAEGRAGDVTTHLNLLLDLAFHGIARDPAPT